MTNTLVFLFGALITAVAFNILYWNIIRPVLLKAILFRIFEKRDALRRMAITDAVSVNSRHYKYLQDILCKTIAIVPNISLVPFAYFAAKYKNVKYPESVQFEISASEELKLLKRQTVADAFSILLINSPFITTIMIILTPAVWILARVQTMKLFQRTEEFVNTLDGELQPA